MRILHVLPSLSPLLGGPSHAIIPMSHSLLSQGLDVHILSTTDGLDDQLAAIKTAGHYHDIPTTLTAPLPLQRKEFIPSYAMYRWLQEHVTSFDVVSLHYLFTFSTTCAAWCSQRKKVPYTVRTIGHCAPWSLAQQRFLKQSYLTLFDKAVLRNAAGIHATSEGEADDIRALVPHSTIATIPLGVSLKEDPGTLSIRDEYHIPKEQPIMLYLSRIHPKKRLDHLLLALQEITTPSTLLIAGSGDAAYLNSLNMLADNLGDHITVQFLGHVSGDLKQSLLHQSDIYILPSYAENFSIATAEAMGAGLPVIIGEGVQIAPHVQTSESGIVIDEQHVSLVAAIQDLLKSPKLRLEMGERGREYVKENFVWEKIGQRLAAFYQSISEKSE